MRFEATITKLARDCTKLGGDITARIGIFPGGGLDPTSVRLVQVDAQANVVATLATLADDGNLDTAIEESSRYVLTL